MGMGMGMGMGMVRGEEGYRAAVLAVENRLDLRFK